jgi:serine/threonine protein kinase
MPLVLTCACGHRWEYTGSTLPTSAPWRVTCPSCAAPVELPRSLHRNGPEDSGPGDSELGSTAPATLSGADVPADIPGYELLEPIDAGGMGAVYLARQQSLNRLVALKVIRAGTAATPQELLRFRREAEAVARLDHPHIVRIYDFGEHQGRPYFSMEFVEGGTLAQQLAGPHLPPRESARLLEILARAAHYAHQAGVIHRDLKPSNILLACGAGRTFQPDPQPLAGWVPKITDFGLAKVLGEDHRLTDTGAVMGTASYMSPEAADGQAQTAGPAADVYALGAILYEALTGRPPFRAATRERTLYQVLHEDPVPPTQLRPDVPPELEAVCLKCLEKDPGCRYPSAADLADDLRRFLDGEPLSILPETEWDRQVRWARRAGYELLELVGCSALGLVFTARHVNLDRLVTLKTVSTPAQLEPEQLDRFRAEAQAAAHLQHPNIAQIYDFGEHQGRPYFSLEHVEGGRLTNRCQGVPQPPEEAAVMIMTLAAATHAAHQQGIVHGDLRPHNVLLTAGGAPKITGFGLGRLLQKDPREARRGRPGRGLSSYMAPEQAEGRAEDIGPATDVHALGAMLYEMLCGQPPYLAATVAETLDLLRRGEPEPPAILRPEVPRRLEEICLKCLRKDSRQRYPSAGELADELRRWLAREKTKTVEFYLIPGYELLRELGRGGIGVVYEARQVALDRPVALKIFRERVRRVQSTVRAVSRLQHPNLVRVFDCGERDGLLYVAEELIEGPRLDQFLGGRPQPPREAAALVEILARALHNAHAHGIIHRNLKPSVVLLAGAASERTGREGEDRPWGTPKVGSFDLALLLGEAPEADEEGELVGTLTFMAPEQTHGQARLIGPATDVHALGAILYECLTGRPPFQAETAQELLDQVRLAAPVFPRKQPAGGPRPLEAICLKCLDKDPTRRYASAEALADDLRSFLGGRPTVWQRVRGWFLGN